MSGACAVHWGCERQVRFHLLLGFEGLTWEKGKVIVSFSPFMQRLFCTSELPDELTNSFGLVCFFPFVFNI